MVISAHSSIPLSLRAYAAVFVRVSTGVIFTFLGENTEREKSMMYLTVFEQNKHGVSRTSGFSSVVTFSGKDRRHSVQVITMYGTPFESFPFRGIQTGAELL
jgi:hypothetical protein